MFFSERMLVKIRLDQIGCDPKFYPRVNGEADWMVVHRYKQALQTGSKFPPITVFPATGCEWKYQLGDGAHRLRSHMQAGLDEIEATVERIPQSKWFARSVELNAIHGRGLDTGDKAWIGERLQEDGYSLEDAARMLRMPVESLEKIIDSRVVKLTGKARKMIPEGRSHRELERGAFGFLKAPLIGANGTAQAMAALESQSRVASRDVADILDSFISVLRSGVLDMSNADIATKMSVIRELLA
jgi:hypothetical protein